ncbi:hypothetical protein H4R20_000249 [Coemansia guatemalensis]|uniref:GPI inositol-deacylase n=1 Tax=Coemansia guatemalensis TaxID=2761395 RepID=A0A9W8I1D9_9FUNG|nr:hypothetical protein H4R20_000249 [Coemansia guatemalensis]
MSATFSVSRFMRLLREQVSLFGTLGRRAREVVKFGTLPFIYANAPQVNGGTSTTNTGSTGETLNKARLNEQIPLQPIYIAPRNPMVLCHGLYGFDVRGPERLPMLQVHYWRGIREALEAVGARVMVAKVSSTGGVRERAQQLDAQLASRLDAEKVNILGHSMGGLDARYLITHINPKSYSVASLTTVCTPHRGSPFMDWCRDYLSLGYRVDPDQLIRDFAAVWKPSETAAATAAAAAAGNTSDKAAQMAGVPDALLRERIDSIIQQAMGSDDKELEAYRQADGGIDPGDRRLQEFAQFLTRILGENASVGESSQLSRLERTSAMSDDYLSRSIALLRMAYRRIMAALDTPAYACLTTDYCQRFFNPSTPNVPGVEYLSIGAYMDPTDISGKVNPLIIPHDIIYKAEGPNDGFVSLTSAQWGHFLGSVCADHFDFTNRWRLSSMGRDFIGTVAYWSSKWSSWLSREHHQQKDHQKQQQQRVAAGMPGNTTNAGGMNTLDGSLLSGVGASGSSRFDPIDFYLRVGTILYQRGY